MGRPRSRLISPNYTHTLGAGLPSQKVKLCKSFPVPPAKVGVVHGRYSRYSAPSSAISNDSLRLTLPPSYPFLFLSLYLFFSPPSLPSSCWSRCFLLVVSIPPSTHPSPISLSLPVRPLSLSLFLFYFSLSIARWGQLLGYQPFCRLSAHDRPNFFSSTCFHFSNFSGALSCCHSTYYNLERPISIPTSPLAKFCPCLPTAGSVPIDFTLGRA